MFNSHSLIVIINAPFFWNLYLLVLDVRSTPVVYDGDCIISDILIREMNVER